MLEYRLNFCDLHIALDDILRLLIFFSFFKNIDLVLNFEFVLLALIEFVWTVGEWLGFWHIININLGICFMELRMQFYKSIALQEHDKFVIRGNDEFLTYTELWK